MCCVVSDLETLKVQAEAAARMGYTGKQVWNGDLLIRTPLCVCPGAGTDVYLLWLSR